MNNIFGVVTKPLFDVNVFKVGSAVSVIDYNLGEEYNAIIAYVHPMYIDLLRYDSKVDKAQFVKVHVENFVQGAYEFGGLMKVSLEEYHKIENSKDIEDVETVYDYHDDSADNADNDYISDNGSNKEKSEELSSIKAVEDFEDENLKDEDFEDEDFEDEDGVKIEDSLSDSFSLGDEDGDECEGEDESNLVEYIRK